MGDGIGITKEHSSAPRQKLDGGAIAEPDFCGRRGNDVWISQSIDLGGKFSSYGRIPWNMKGASSVIQATPPTKMEISTLQLLT
jgi:hypothetical protein